MFRRITTPTETTTNANSVPMLTRSASADSGTRPATAATAIPMATVKRYGVPYRGCTAPSQDGSSPSRLIAKNTRLCPSMRISTTVVRPASAPMLTTVAKPGRPTARNASDSGASTLSRR